MSPDELEAVDALCKGNYTIAIHDFTGSEEDRLALANLRRIQAIVDCVPGLLAHIRQQAQELEGEKRASKIYREEAEGYRRENEKLKAEIKDDLDSVRSDICRNKKDVPGCQEFEMDYTEELAALAHEQWSGWMAHLFSKCFPNEDGTVNIPKWAVDRWTRQMNTPYADLPEDEKESDRKEARRCMDVACLSYRI